MASQTHGIKEQLNAHMVAYGEELLGFIQGRMGYGEEAEDLLQEAWYRMGKALEQEVIAQPRAWLYRVVRNLIIDHYRRVAADPILPWPEEDPEEPAFSPADEDPGPDQVFWAKEFWEAFYEALEALPTAQREVFVQNEFEGLTLREIAEQSGTSLKTIISRKGYAVRRLRGELGDWFADLRG